MIPVTYCVFKFKLAVAISSQPPTAAAGEAVKAIATAADKKDETKASDAATEKKDDNKENKNVGESAEHGYAHGTYHWTLERASAVTLVPLMSTQMIWGAHPIVDGLLGVILPFHIHMGFDSCITDYIPKRVYPRLHPLAKWSLRAATALTMWGLYEFNTNDLGVTEGIARIWTA
ncbi:CybS-domain-containing protein [Radiomyces spectabilis]|uniref:CybS-domain-containing protein n=1 Tax=Radiomyces spectabilis TaxID=64574 RepID=UPI00221F75D4|nr:CybS-domain-containing protein [Radiomyces spectabilis]KAI8393473.1 CybS-domain-containing protein [Radiomyces spectabilis]